MTQQRCCICLHCQEEFRPDHRNIGRQKYCSKPECQKASKAVSQSRWLGKPENQDYFKGPDHVQRVRQWREKHPGYWKRPRVLQDTCKSKPVENAEKTGQSQASPLQEGAYKSKPVENAEKTGQSQASPLQDVLTGQHPVLIGLISSLTGSTLQEDIVRTAMRFVQLGQDILSGHNDIHGGRHGSQIRYSP
ncbi:MAG: hypothetical protein HQL80_05200 [Magnetococcales bacterium]|nr:hypothetical protein [Magnetococcales bacterium]